MSRSYQYVAMHNVNNKLALKQGGWNMGDSGAELKDHTMRETARSKDNTSITTTTAWGRTRE